MYTSWSVPDYVVLLRLMSTPAGREFADALGLMYPTSDLMGVIKIYDSCDNDYHNMPAALQFKY